MPHNRRRLMLGTLAAVGTPLFAPGVLGQSRTKIVLTQATDSLTFTPVYIARALKLFEEEGLDVSVVITDGDGPDVQALLAGESQFAVSNSLHLMTLYQQGRRLSGVAAVVGRLANNVCIRKSAAEPRGITAQSSFEDKLKAFKGLKVGCSLPGSLTFNLAMHYIKRAGLTPQTDAQVVAVGAGPAAIAAIERSVVDAYIFGSPLIEQIIERGSSFMLINNTRGEDPQFREFVQATLYVRPDYAKERGDIVRRMVRAIVNASAWVIDNPPEAIVSALKPFFGRVDEGILVSAVTNLKQVMVRTGRVTPEMASAVHRFYTETGAVKKDVPFDAIFTNDYLPG